MKRIVRYRSLGSVYLSLGLTVNGKSATVDFIGGSAGASKRLPFFQTDDPAIQKAMESSSGFGLYYAIEWEDVKEETEVKTPEDTIPEDTEGGANPDQGNDDINIFGDETPSATIAPPKKLTAEGITNAQDAKAYLTEMFNGQVGQMTNKASILAEAERLGVAFVDWK